MKIKTLITMIAMSIMIVLSYVIAMGAGKGKDALFQANLEVLADTEEGIYGNCMEVENECLLRCPHCMELLYAPDHYGPAYDIHGICPNCHEEL